MRDDRVDKIALGFASAMCARMPRRFMRGERGGAILEVALLISLLGVPLMLGTAEMACVVYDAIEISNAAHAGAMYGMQSATFAANTSGIITAAQTEASDFGSALTVTPTAFYACATAPSGTKYTGTNAESNATAACTGGTNHALEFIQVSVSGASKPPIHCPGLLSTFTLSNSSVMEVEQ